jgi:hypothetical protein
MNRVKSMAKFKFINLRIAQHHVWLWILAFLITAGSAVYQRMTGPTYPYRGKATIGENKVSFKLIRSETVNINAEIKLTVPDTAVSGYLRYRRYKSHDEWSNIPMERDGDHLTAYLPHQPAAGKIIYFVYLSKGNEEISLSGGEAIIIRYKGAVPSTVLIPHVLLMFLAMLYSNRAALESLDSQGDARRYMLWTMGFFFVGGFILGPAVQKYAFDALWTGFPFGYDLTDNKTLIGMLGWVWAWFMNRKGRDGRGWIFFAALLLLAVYLIPHSVLGSELDYTKQ